MAIPVSERRGVWYEGGVADHILQDRLLDTEGGQQAFNSCFSTDRDHLLQFSQYSRYVFGSGLQPLPGGLDVGELVSNLRNAYCGCSIFASRW